MARPLPDDITRYFTTSVALITTHSSRGPNVMAAEWTFNVSYDPLLVAVVLSAHTQTHGAILESKEFGVNLACEEQYALCSFAGGFSGREASKLTSGAISTRPGEAIRAPMVEGSLAQLECRLVAVHEVGDHTQFVGEVVAARSDPAKRPLALHRGYRPLGERIPRGRHLFLAVTPEAQGRVRVDGLYYADQREGARVELEAFDREGRPLARGEATTDRGGFLEWRPEAPAGRVARVRGAAAGAEGEATAAPATPSPL